MEELVFKEGGKTENPEKNPRSKVRIKNKLNPTYDIGAESNPSQIGGEASALTTVITL